MSTLLEAYKVEFETSDISIEELCQKYNTTKSKLKGYTKWAKNQEVEKQEPIVELVKDQKPVIEKQKPIVELVKKQEIEKQEPVTELVKDKKIEEKEISSKIENIKLDLLVKVEKELTNEYVEPLLLKNLTDVVLKIENSYKDNEGTTNNIQVLIQNLKERYIDDC